MLFLLHIFLLRYSHSFIIKNTHTLIFKIENEFFFLIFIIQSVKFQ